MNTLVNVKTDIIEIFSSIQGEGIYMGERHLFIRFSNCNLNCVYCDEVNKKTQYLNLDDLVERVLLLEAEEGPHSFISLTGGEPLCHDDFVEVLCEELKRRGMRILLETNGTLSTELARIIKYVDSVAMDIKLSSVWEVNDCYERHRKFLEVMSQHDGYIKITISHDVIEEEFMMYVDLIARYNDAIPVILQPLVHTAHPMDDTLTNVMTSLQQMSRHTLKHVRILPRIQTLLNVK